MTTSFHRTEVSTGYILLIDQIGAGCGILLSFPSFFVRQCTLQMRWIPTDYHHTIYELEGDIQDLARCKKSVTS